MSPPVLVYDDDCDFCTRSARFLKRHGDLDILGFAELDSTVLDRLPDDYEECAHFVTEEAVYSCGAAVEEAFARTQLVPAQVFPLLHEVPYYTCARERSYFWVADNRGRISDLLPGSSR